METGFFSVAALDEIVFEGRNKAYGAYVLRQEYPLQVIKATGISLLLVFIFATWLVALGQQVPEEALKAVQKDRSPTLVTEPYIPAPRVAEQLAPPPTVAARLTASKVFRVIKIVPDLTPVVNDIPEQADFTWADPGLATLTGELPGPVAPEAGAGIGPEKGTATETKEPFEVVEKMPEYLDGQDGMYRFINKHLRYPPEAKIQGLAGMVILTFVVSATGEISDIKILRDIGGGAGAEAKRVVARMPRWRPGLQHQRAVPVRFTLPIRFRIN